MIVVRAIIVESALKPEFMPDNNCGNHCDGINFYFFESQDEARNYINNLNQVDDNNEFELR